MQVRAVGPHHRRGSVRSALAGEELGVELNLFISRGEAAEAATADKDGIQGTISNLLNNNRPRHLSRIHLVVYTSLHQRRLNTSFYCVLKQNQTRYAI